MVIGHFFLVMVHLSVVGYACEMARETAFNHAHTTLGGAYVSSRRATYRGLPTPFPGHPESRFAGEGGLNGDRVVTVEKT